LANGLVLNGCLNFGYQISFRLFDKGFIEVFGPMGLVNNLFKMARSAGASQTGYIYTQFLVIITFSLFLSLALCFNLLFALPFTNSSFLILIFCYILIALTKIG